MRTSKSVPSIATPVDEPKAPWPKPCKRASCSLAGCIYALAFLNLGISTAGPPSTGSPSVSASVSFPVEVSMPLTPLGVAVVLNAIIKKYNQRYKN